MSLRDVVVIARFDVWRHIRSRHGMLSLAMLALFCAISGWRLADYADEIARVGTATGPAMRMVAAMIEGVTNLPATAIADTIQAHPPVLVALFALVLSLLPLWALVTTYDQTASDIETRHVRYLLFRTDRTSIYLGKTLGAWALVAGSLALALTLLVGFLALRSDAVGGLAGTLYVVRIWATSTLFALPFVALFGLIGALAGRARRALSFAMMYWIGTGVALGIAIAATSSSGYGLEYLFPTAHRYDLLVDDPAAVLPTATYDLGFALVCIGLGRWRFMRRDL